MQSYYANLGIEVTRRCNQVCENFCMRGASQTMDIPVEYIDLFLDQKRNQYKAVDQLLFSGGEPTLNEDAIVYTVQKIPYRFRKCYVIVPKMYSIRIIKVCAILTDKGIF